MRAHEPGDDDAKPHFRAVMAGGVRRGLRLEQIYWRGLSEISQLRGMTVGDLVAAVHDRTDEGGSLSSAVRSYVAQHYINRCQEFETRMAADHVAAIVHSIPSPAFALTSSRRIVHYNGPFIAFLQLGFSGPSSQEAFRNLALTLDTKIEDVINELQESRGRPTSSGFAIGIAEKRVRGKLNMALVPSADEPIVLSTIVQ
ncbi:MAG: ribbon-helix-helix domain-containing protein [Pseudomonadota bacterium]